MVEAGKIVGLRSSDCEETIGTSKHIGMEGRGAKSGVLEEQTLGLLIRRLEISAKKGTYLGEILALVSLVPLLLLLSICVKLRQICAKSSVQTSFKLIYFDCENNFALYPAIFSELDNSMHRHMDLQVNVQYKHGPE